MDGNYTLSERDGDNFEKYMAAVGVGLIMRKAAKNLNQTAKISCDGDTIHIITGSTLKSSDEVFQVGVEKPVTTMDGRKVQCTLTRRADGNGWTITEKWSGKTTTIDQYLDADGNLVFDLNMEGTTCRRVYERD